MPWGFLNSTFVYGFDFIPEDRVGKSDNGFSNIGYIHRRIETIYNINAHHFILHEIDDEFNVIEKIKFLL